MAFLTSLKRALTANFLLVASLPVLFFGLVSIQLMTDQQLAGIHERNLLQAKSIAEEVDIFLKEVNADLQHVSETLASQKILQPGSSDLYLSQVVRSSQFFESIYYLDPQLNVLHLGLIPKLESRRGDYSNLDFSGHHLFRSDGALKDITWSNTFVSVVTGEPSVTLGVPIAGGFLLGNVRLKSLGRLLARYAEYSNIEVAIIDSNGTLIAHSIEALAIQRLNFGNHPSVVSAMNGEDSTGEYKQGKNHILESATLIPSSNWVVWVGLNMDAVNAPIDYMRNTLIAFMAVALLLAGMIALLIIKRLMLPITALGDRANQIADGQYEFQFRHSGYVEIDTLARQIQSMTEAIKVREESIIANEKRFRDLVNSIDGIVWEMTYPGFSFLFVSRQAEAILGYPVYDWYENPSFWQDKVHDEDIEQAKAYCQLMAEKHEDHDFEYRMIAADGRIVWIRDLVTVVVENDRPVRLLGVMIDITAQKELLDELMHNEQNYREIFNASSDAIFVHDAETGKVVDVNESMLKLFNATYADALSGGAEAYSLGESPYSAEEAYAKLQEARLKGHCTFEWHCKKQSGELFWGEVYLRSAMIGGQPRILAAVRDISERRATEVELANYRSNLEALVQERSLQLEKTQAELVQKERLAVLGQLTATVSHEIRNPLGTVANSIYLLKESLPPSENPQLARPLQLAERNVERCDSIISDLLDFSRQRAIEKLPVEIDVWLDELFAELSFPETIQVQKDFAAATTVPIDAERMRRVIINVVTNALQALDEVDVPDKTVSVRTRLSGERCEIEVCDNGPGMSAEVLDHIFEPMFSTKTFGVGLGVPIIKNILEGHGGGVTYHSEVGKGTTVAMWLPI